MEQAISDERQALLGVKHSLMGQSWAARDVDMPLVEAIAQRAGLPEIVARVIAGRGVGLDGVEQFLTPSLRESLPDPSILKDMDSAAQRLAAAVKRGEPITVFGDYDVDGATSSGVFIQYLRTIGADAGAYIPDRLSEGYGPNAKALEHLASQGVKVVVTVDCGIQAYDALAAGTRAGLEIIVIDHHKAEPELPEAVAVVNPNRLDDDSGLGHLAAVGVTYLLIIALNRALRQEGYFNGTRTEPNLLQFLDMVALGTVCDVVPLKGLNRVFVRQGLKVMAQRRNIGLTALMDVSGLDAKPDAYHLGFLLGPRINAGGRVGESDSGTRLLTMTDGAQAFDLAQHLDQLNKERQAIEAAVLEAALAQVGDPGGAPFILAHDEGWHPGVVGIVASRLKDRFQRPAFVIGFENGVGKGSGRSISGVDLGAAVIAARQEGLLLNGGGHAMAAGLTVEHEQMKELSAFLTTHLTAQVARAQASRGLTLDGVLSLSGVTPELVEQLEQAGPFGVGNPTPRFAIPDCTIVAADIVGKDHLRLILAQGQGARIKAMAFRQGDTQFGQTLLHSVGQKLHVAGRLKRDDWGARPKAELHLDDADLIN
ncbi:MAG: single-stranded-DNA-specific exonuclease RecJ [Sphingomonadales bacterium]|jgi:single-stranded-DNA-specific exonuclease